MIRGSVSAVNTALKSLVYKPKKDWNSDAGAINEIQSVKLTVASPKEVVSVKSKARRGLLNGSFVLKIDQSNFGLKSIDTVEISTNATAAEVQAAVGEAVNGTQRSIIRVPYRYNPLGPSTKLSEDLYSGSLF